MESDSLKLINLLIRRSWLILLAAVITGGVAFYLRDNQEPNYTASALISIGDPTSIADPSEALITTGELLAQQYSFIIETELIMTSIIEELGLDQLDSPITPKKLRGMVSTSTVADTSFLRINVGNADPQLAADIANAIARYLVENNLSEVEEAERQYLEQIGDQITELNLQYDDSSIRIAQIDTELATLNAQFVVPPTAIPEETPDPEATDEAIIIGEATPDPIGGGASPFITIDEETQTRINELRAERSALTIQRGQSLQTLADLRNLQTDYSIRINDVEILDPARVPTSAGGISPIIVAVAGVIAGSILAVTVILFFEFIDTTIRDEDEATNMLGVPVVGSVPKSRKIRTSFKDYDSSKSTEVIIVSESYRTIQTNLFLSATKRESNIYLIVSPREQEGRSITASNMAVVAAESGMKVLLIDADLRDPSLHKVFGADNKRGLATLMALAAGQLNVETSKSANLTETDNRLAGVLKKHIQDTKVPNLKLITSGLGDIEVSAKILGFDSLAKYLDAIQQLVKFDLILIDTPPALRTADSYILAATTKANVVLLVESGKTTRASAVRMRDQLTHNGVTMSGIILNKL